MHLRRLFPLAASLAVAAAPATAQPALAQPQPARAPALHPVLAAAADSFAALSAEAQRSVTESWGDGSDSARLAGFRRQDAVAARLRAVPASALRDPAARLLHANLSEISEARRGARACRYHLWAGTSQFGGWHVAASNAARVQPVGTPAAREAALAHFARLPAVIRQERALLARGLDSGWTQSRAVIATVVRQLDDLLPAEVERSPLWSPAARDSTPEFADRWRRLLADSLYPAARAWRAFLDSTYAPRARAEGSLGALPAGVACYEAGLRAQTSVRVDADSLLAAARRDYDRVAAELAPLVRQLTGEADLGRGIIALRADPRFTFPARDSVLPAYQAMTAVAASRIGRVVAGFAPESVAVVAYPAFQENAGLPPQYLRASDDGSRPAQFMVNLGRTERMSVANAVAHEAYPGHHLQRIASMRAPVVHPAMRTLFVGGFIEGWGIYSERLADEMGLYETPLDRAGYLVHLLDVMVAAWLDAGYHAKGWSRQALIDTMVAKGGRPPAMAAAYADRHAATPGQLATYYVGFDAIVRQRERAERALGARFRAPEFHHEILRDGTVTLASLEDKTTRWIARERARR